MFTSCLSQIIYGGVLIKTPLHRVPGADRRQAAIALQLRLTMDIVLRLPWSSVEWTHVIANQRVSARRKPRNFSHRAPREHCPPSKPCPDYPAGSGHGVFNEQGAALQPQCQLLERPSLTRRLCKIQALGSCVIPYRHDRATTGCTIAVATFAMFPRYSQFLRAPRRDRHEWSVSSCCFRSLGRRV